MPVDLNNLFAQAPALQEAQQFHVNEEGDLAAGSDLHGLSKLSRSAHREENRAAVNAFIQSLQLDPAYAALLAEVRAPLDVLIENGRPLTSSTVSEVKLALDVAQAVHIGKDLAEAGKLPLGHGTSFGQFVAARGIPVDTPQEQAVAVREYLSGEVIPKNIPAMTHIPDFGDKTAVVDRILTAVHGPKQAFLADAAARLLEGGLDNFSLEALEGAWQDACADDIAVCRNIQHAAIDSLLAAGKPADTMATLREALPIVGAENLTVLRQGLFNAPSLATPVERAGAVTEFFINRDAVEIAAPMVTAQGLPESFATAIGHNPEVIAEAQNLLADNPGAAVMPTREQVRTAMETAVGHFLEAKGALLHELHVMAENPPIDLEPDLTPETMPRYINTMIAGDAVLEALVNDGTPIDADFMTKVGQQAAAMNSAAHSIRGDYGSDDAIRVLNGSMRLLIARRGVPDSMLPELASRALAKAGQLACDVCSVNGAIQSGKLRGPLAYSCLSEGLSVYRLLETQSQTLIHMLSDDQRAALGASAFNPEQPGRSRLEINRAQENFIEANFQKERPLTKISDAVRGFFEARGLKMPAAAPDAPDGVQSVLAESNRRMGETVLGLLVRSSDRALEPATDDFRAFFAEASANNDLSRIDIDTLNTAPLAQDAENAVNEYVAAQTNAGRPVDPAHCRALAEGRLLDGLKALQATLAGIDAFPDRVGMELDAPGFTAASKAMFKDVAQHYGIRDVGVIRAIADAAVSVGMGITVRELSAPVATGSQITSVASDLGAKYRRACACFPAGAAVSNDVPAMFAEMSLRASDLNAQEFGYVAENLQSDMAKTVAGGFRWLADQKYGEKATAAATDALMLMNAFLTQAQVINTGNAEIKDVYDYKAPNLRALPGGVDGVVNKLNSMAGMAIPTIEVELANVVPGLSDEACDAVRGAWNRYKDEAESSIRTGFMLPGWLADNADAVLAATKANKGQPPTISQMWDVLTGGGLGKMPGSIKKGGMGLLLDAVQVGYQRLVKTAVPDMPAQQAANLLQSFYGAHLPLPKLIALAKPDGGELDKSDIHENLGMSSLRSYDAHTAYGLCTDFRRQAPQALLTFQRADGQRMTVHPQWIPDEDNKPNNPIFQDIIGFWRGMTQSDAQLRRLGQAFSQASLIMPRVMSQAFPGVQYDEHGNFAMTAQARADGTIVVDIGTPPDAPVALHEQFVIQPDGTHECTAFNMRRGQAE